jgi:hypothetical protein
MIGIHKTVYYVFRMGVKQVFEGRVLRRIFGPKREEVAEGRRRLH